MTTSNLTKLIDRGDTLKEDSLRLTCASNCGNFSLLTKTVNLLSTQQKMLTIMAEALERAKSYVDWTREQYAPSGGAQESDYLATALSRVNELAGKALS